MLRSRPDPIARKRIFRQLTMCAVLVGILATPTLSQASEYTAARKVLRGLAAMTTGFLEVPGNMVAEMRERGPAMGLPLGFVLGLGKIVVRELVGVYEFVSAPFEVPAGFEPIIEPEYPWEYFQQGGASSDNSDF